ncbi:MAG: hypothetical protein JXL97_08930 [Bacteroidales bacterium]|nr:hypothetical protein [Bacteroidales bacterium]
MYKKYIFAILTVIVAIFGCKDDAEDNSNISSQLDTSDVFESIKKVYYSLPSPMEIASIAKKYSGVFSAEVMNPTSNVIEYTTTDAQAINLGVYAADLAFVSLYDQKQYSAAIFKCLIDLADEIDILEGINDTLVRKVEENIENPNEIKDIIADAFFKSDAYLKESGREKIATLIMAGAWVESFYLMSDMAVKTDDTTHIYQLIVDQRLVLDNVIMTLNIQNIDSEIIDPLKDINENLNNCVTIEKTEVLDPYTDEMRTKTIVKYNYSSKKIEEIYGKISIIRKNFISLH